MSAPPKSTQKIPSQTPVRVGEDPEAESAVNAVELVSDAAVPLAVSVVVVVVAGGSTVVEVVDCPADVVVLVVEVAIDVLVVEVAIDVLVVLDGNEVDVEVVELGAVDVVVESAEAVVAVVVVGATVVEVVDCGAVVVVLVVLVVLVVESAIDVVVVGRVVEAVEAGEVLAVVDGEVLGTTGATSTCRRAVAAVVGVANVVDGPSVVVVVAPPAEAGTVVADSEEVAGAALVVVVKASGFFLEPPVATVTMMMMMINTTAAITHPHLCLWRGGFGPLGASLPVDSRRLSPNTAGIDVADMSEARVGPVPYLASHQRFDGGGCGRLSGVRIMRCSVGSDCSQTLGAGSTKGD